MRATDPNAGGWPAALGRATTLGFDTLLLPPGEMPAGLIDAAQGRGVALLSDIVLDTVPADWLDGAPGPFMRTPAPLTDPRHGPALSEAARVAIGTNDDVQGLVAFWAPRIRALVRSGLAGVRLLGLRGLPGWAVPGVVTGLRAACPECLLFGWTPGLAWPVLQAIPGGSLDLVAASLPWWDGQADWLWRELEILRAIGPVVADGGSDHTRQAFAAMLAEGWMATADAVDAEALIGARRMMSGLSWTTPVGPGGGPAYALLRTDAADPRRANRAALAVTAFVPATLPADLLLSGVQGDFHRFTSPSGDALHPGTTLSLDAGGLRLFTAKARDRVPPAALGRKRAEAAAMVSRVAIEAPSPCVENGRFPARQVVGSEVVVEADLIADGHDKLGAVLRYRAPGEEEWTEVRMQPVSNDRWIARFPLDRLGVHEYGIEAWKDAYATFVDELQKKHAAGVPIALELQEGALLVREAADRAKKSLAAVLAPVVKILETEGPDARREALLAPDTQAAMARADERPRSASIGPIRVQAERTAAGFASWYEVFPRSLSDDPARHGTFRDVVRHLPRVQAMGFDVLYFPPFHPIGRVNRKGRNNTLTPAADDPGSPYAIGSDEGGHEALHPELGTIEDFQHLRQEAAKHGIELAMDFAIQCAPDHPWLTQHKGWFDWRPDGSIKYAENPPKKYQDIVNVDFYAEDAVPDLWLALANAVLYWAGQGIRLFRVDNPHTKPLPFWEWMITEVQARYPDAVFLAEAFTRPKVMYRLAKAGFGQSYTYFTWRNTKQEFQAYLTELTDPRPGSPREYFRPHFFVNTPDINPVPLQNAPRQAFLVRVALASTLSGLWGLYNGFELCEATPIPGREEYLDSEKYQIRAWDWNRPGNIVAEIATLNAIRKRNPALQTHLGVTFLNADNDQVLLFEKATPDRSNVVLVAINMDLRNPQASRIEVPFWRWSIGAPESEPTALLATDLLTDRQERWTDHSRTVSLTATHPYAIWRLRPEVTA
jgi:starch synthase (maltosyl-transferring)